MAIKKLQNNFTTSEQSKRLLELGVPANSADCCLRIALTDGGYEVWIVDVFDFIGQIRYDYLPCWSVGRLIEIFEISTGQVWQNETIENYSKVDMLLEDFEDMEQKYTFDFSKLEE